MLFSWSTEDRDRTGTSVTSLVFETNASTYSATSAQIGGKNTLFFDTADNYFLEPSASRRGSCFGAICVPQMFLFWGHLRLANVLVLGSSASRRYSCLGVICVSRMFLFRSHLRLADVVRRDAARRVSTIISRSTPGYPPISRQEPPISIFCANHRGRSAACSDWQPLAGQLSGCSASSRPESRRHPCPRR